jgi:hypothetical protein
MGLGFVLFLDMKKNTGNYFISFVFISSMGDEIVNNNDRNDEHDTKLDGNFILKSKLHRTSGECQIFLMDRWFLNLIEIVTLFLHLKQ